MKTLTLKRRALGNDILTFGRDEKRRRFALIHEHEGRLHLRMIVIGGRYALTLYWR